MSEFDTTLVGFAYSENGTALLALKRKIKRVEENESGNPR